MDRPRGLIYVPIAATGALLLIGIALLWWTLSGERRLGPSPTPIAGQVGSASPTPPAVTASGSPSPPPRLADVVEQIKRYTVFVWTQQPDGTAAGSGSGVSLGSGR